MLSFAFSFICAEDEDFVGGDDSDVAEEFDENYSSEESGDEEKGEKEADGSDAGN